MRISSVLISCLMLASVASGQPASDSSALINEQLDKLVKFELNDIPLPQVFQSIERQTGVPVRPDDDVYAMLPWGRQTPITASVQNLPLRDALEAICGKLGLQFSLGDEAVLISPVPALKRIGGRATLNEIHAIDLLDRTPLGPDARSITLAELIDRIDKALVSVKPDADKSKPLVVEFRPGDVPLDRTITLSRNATLFDALNELHLQSRLTWYPWASAVVIVPKSDVVKNQLNRQVNLRYDGVDIAQIFQDLSKQTGIEFMIEPGALQRVAAEYRIINLLIDAPVRQALETLQGRTGLGYVVTDDGVYIWNQSSTPAGGRGRVAALVPVEGVGFGLIHEDQLTPAARAKLKQVVSEKIELIEKALVPATQPTHHN
jgi:hypothetical protein